MTPHASPQIITLNPASDAGALRAVRLACVTDTAGATSGAEWDALDRSACIWQRAPKTAS